MPYVVTGAEVSYRTDARPAEITLGLDYGIEGLKMHVENVEKLQRLEEKYGYDDDWLEMFQVVNEDIYWPQGVVRETEELAEFAEQMMESEVEDDEIRQMIERAEDLYDALKT